MSILSGRERSSPRRALDPKLTQLLDEVPSGKLSQIMEQRRPVHPVRSADSWKWVKMKPGIGLQVVQRFHLPGLPIWGTYFDPLPHYGFCLFVCQNALPPGDSTEVFAKNAFWSTWFHLQKPTGGASGAIPRKFQRKPFGVPPPSLLT